MKKIILITCLIMSFNSSFSQVSEPKKERKINLHLDEEQKYYFNTGLTLGIAGTALLATTFLLKDNFKEPKNAGVYYAMGGAFQLAGIYGIFQGLKKRK